MWDSSFRASPGRLLGVASFFFFVVEVLLLARVCSSVSGFLVDKGLLEVAIKNKEGGGA